MAHGRGGWAGTRGTRQEKRGEREGGRAAGSHRSRQAAPGSAGRLPPQPPAPSPRRPAPPAPHPGRSSRHRCRWRRCRRRCDGSREGEGGRRQAGVGRLVRHGAAGGGWQGWGGWCCTGRLAVAGRGAAAAAARPAGIQAALLPRSSCTRPPREDGAGGGAAVDARSPFRLPSPARPSTRRPLRAPPPLTRQRRCRRRCRCRRRRAAPRAAR